MNPYDTINTQLSAIPLAEDRAAAQRWFLRFLASNTRFHVFQAASMAAQTLSRWGIDVIRDTEAEPWAESPLPATRQEWLADGYRVPEEARPLLIVDRAGRPIELFLLYDVELVDADLVGTVEHDVVRDPAEPAEGAPDLAEFALQLSARERRALGHLWKMGTVVEWADVESNAEVYTGPLGWLERCNRNPYCRPLPELRGADACFRIFIHPDADGREVMSLVMSLLAEMLSMYVQGRRAGHPLCGHPDENITDLEVGLVSWIVGNRLAMGGHHANVDTYRYLEIHRDTPATDEVNWGRVVETAQVMEDLLLGAPEAVVPIPGVPDLPESTFLHLANDAYGGISRVLMARSYEEDGETAERWVLDFVSENRRFSLQAALALGWQLYVRWGAQVVGDASRSDWAGSMELRSIEEWAMRGWVPRPGAEMLVATGSHGQLVSYYLREDVIIADRLSALQASVEVDRDFSEVFRPAPADAPELAEFDGLVTPREKEMLRNLWRVKVRPVLSTPEEADAIDLRNAEQSEYRLPVLSDAPAGHVMCDVIGDLANWVLTHELGEIATAPIIGRRFFAATEWESAIVAHVVGRRLEICAAHDTLVEEALTREDRVPGLIRWGLLFHAATSLEDTLRGYPRE